MAKSCGIHIDQRSFHLIALDGSARKHKVIAHASGEIPYGEDPVEFVAQGLRRAVKKKKISGDGVGLAVDSGLAAFRTITLPFDDRAKIEEVIKFEIENDLPQWNIDDVIVDFHVVASKPGVQSSLLVSALPKERLAMQLAACEEAGLEANDAELDGTALFNAAYEAGVLEEDSAQLLVHIGDATTVVVLVDGGRLASIRAIRGGRMAVPKEVSVDLDDEDSLEPEARESEEVAADAERLLAQTAQRIRRELSRTVLGARTENTIETIFLCGGELPGLSDEETLVDLPVQPLYAVPPVEGADDPQALVIAYGAALSQLGAAKVSSHLRREDLRYSGKFERLELPMAVFALLLCTLLGVKFITLTHQLNWRDQWELDPASPKKGDMQIWLRASNTWMMPDPENGVPGHLKNPPEDVIEYVERVERGEDSQRTTYQQLLEVQRLLVIEKDRLQKDLGQVSSIPQPQSALHGMALVTGVIEKLGKSVGRLSIRSLASDYAFGKGGDADSVIVKLDMDFFAEDALEATGNYTRMVNTLQENPWCKTVAKKTTREFDDGGGISVDGLTVEVDLAQAAEVGS